jgi:malate/lactate dehydrogenase
MQGVAIVGAGELGGTLAHVLALRGIAGPVRIVDDVGRVAAGKALDIMHSAAASEVTANVSGATDLTAAVGAAVIVVADRADGNDWHGDDGVLLLKRLAHFAGESIVVCAGAAQRELVDSGVRELRFQREHIFGSAPEALAAALRAIVALEMNGSPRDVALTILGVPPAQVVVPWEDATIGGFAAVRVLDERTRRRVGARIAALWPPGPRALAVSAAKAVAGVLGTSHQTITAFIAPDDGFGRRARTAALPVKLGPGGMTPVDLPRLSVHDQVSLDNALLL